jgi:hypothetical protein
MRDQDFEKIMEAWAEQETASAPDLHPTADMYRMVQARQKRRPILPIFSPRVTLAAAAASLTLFVVAYILLFPPSMRSDSPPVQRVALLGQREGFVPESDVVVRGATIGSYNEKNRTGPPPVQLLLHLQKRDALFVEAINLLAPPKETITLTSADNYRLLLAPGRDGYVYVFQLTSSNTLVKLFPNRVYSAAQNPLQRGQTHYLPSKPNWFYLDPEPGKERLYIVASPGSLPDLEDLYARYSQAQSETDQQEILSKLLEQLETAPDGWVFAFDHSQ